MGPVLYGGLSDELVQTLFAVYIGILWSHRIVLVVWTGCSILERIDGRAHRFLILNIV